MGEPSVSEAEAAQFKNLKPDLAGIAGWLVIVAIGQVFGPLRLLASLGQYYEKMDNRILESFPVNRSGGVVQKSPFAKFLASFDFRLFRQHRPKGDLGDTLARLIRGRRPLSVELLLSK